MTILSIAPTTSMEQPGRLFNKTLNTDAFFQDRRRQKNHQKTGNDHDGFPSIHSPPSTKSSGGAALNSPVSSQDMKHFEPLDYEDDGGVAIDLCLPENNNQNNVDVLLQEQEQEQCCQRLRSPSSFLAPIFEERRVTFAAEHVRGPQGQRHGRTIT